MTLRDFVRRLKADCSTVEGTVLHQHLATAEEVKAVQPGGSDNPEKGPVGWLSYYRWLHRRHAVNEIHQGPRAGASDAINDGLAMDALRGKPEYVTLLAPIRGGTETDPICLALGVFPKALVALVHCHRLSLKLGYLGAHLHTLQQSTTTEDRDVVLQAWERITRIHRQLVWIVTTPGPGLPFDREETPDPDPPAWTGLVDALDVHRIIQAYQRVHGARLIAIDKLAGDPGERPGTSNWSTFVVGAAEALGISTRELQEEIDFPAVVARVRLAAAAQRQAMDEAKAKAEADRGGRE